MPVGKIALYLCDAAQKRNQESWLSRYRKKKTILPSESLSLDSDEPFIFQSW